MAKIYQEEQRYHDLPSLGLLTLVSALVIYKLVAQQLSQQDNNDYTVAGIIALALVLGIVLMWKIRLKIRISTKKMRINLSPLSWTGLQLAKEEVEAIEFFKVTEGDLCSGWALHFGNQTRIFNFGDHSGVIVNRSNGQKIIVFSNKLYRQRDSINSLLQAQGWNISATDRKE